MVVIDQPLYPLGKEAPVYIDREAGWPLSGYVPYGEAKNTNFL
jgi:hypothetical protein